MMALILLKYYYYFGISLKTRGGTQRNGTVVLGIQGRKRNQGPARRCGGASKIKTEGIQQKGARRNCEAEIRGNARREYQDRPQGRKVTPPVGTDPFSYIGQA